MPWGLQRKECTPSETPQRAHLAENVRLRDFPGANYRDDELGVIHQKGLKELLEALTLGKKEQAYDRQAVASRNSLGPVPYPYRLPYVDSNLTLTQANKRKQLVT